MTTDQERAAGKRKAAVETDEERVDPMVAALLEERRGYVVRGRDDRVADVDAELKRRGVKAPTDDVVVDVDTVDIATATKKQLQAVAAARGLDTKGNVDALRERLAPAPPVEPVAPDGAPPAAS